MGSILRATCGCGFDSTNLYVGGGRVNFGTICRVPAICSKCGDLVTVNYLEAGARCPKCGSAVTTYDDLTLRANPGESFGQDTELDSVFSWRIPNTQDDFYLPMAQYLCPRCRKLNMRFHQAGTWD